MGGVRQRIGHMIVIGHPTNHDVGQRLYIAYHDSIRPCDCWRIHLLAITSTLYTNPTNFLEKIILFK